MTSQVIRGVITTLDAFFYNDDNITPQYAVGGVSYTITAANNLLIATGIAEQDPLNLARWKITFSIPSSAPTTGPNEYYTLLWRARRTDGGLNQQKDNFTVVDPDQLNENVNDNAVVAIANQPFNLALRTPDSNITSLSLRIIKAGSETPVITLSNLVDSEGGGLAPELEGQLYTYPVTINQDNLYAISNGISQGGRNGGLTEWYAYYNYVDSLDQDQVSITPIYIVNNTIVHIMNSMNKYCNMLRNNDVVKQLQVTESTLVHFAIQGLMRVNATSPGNFGFDFNSLAMNDTFLFWTIKCAELEMLQAMYLAEGMSAFEFSGMTVQLNSDRTQYIAQAISTIENDIQNQLPRVKSQYARAGGGSGKMGTLGIYYGPNTRYSYNTGLGKWNGNPFPGGIPMLPFLR